MKYLLCEVEQFFDDYDTVLRVVPQDELYESFR